MHLTFVPRQFEKEVPTIVSLAEIVNASEIKGKWSVEWLCILRVSLSLRGRNFP